MFGLDHEARDSSIIGLEGDPSIGFYFSSFFVEANVQARCRQLSLAIGLNFSYRCKLVVALDDLFKPVRDHKPIVALGWIQSLRSSLCWAADCSALVLPVRYGPFHSMETPFPHFFS